MNSKPEGGNVGRHIRLRHYVVAAILFLAVDNIEPNRRYALVLKLLIVFVSVAAVAGRLMP